METVDLLKEISASKQYEIALFTTFNFEIGFFESFILNTLSNNGVRKVSVYADAKQFALAMSEISDCSVGKRYVVNPIDIDNAFHPKLVLLLGQNRAKLVLSSANLTMSGYCGNSEVVNVFVFDEAHPETLKLISHAIRFFEKLDQLSYGLDSEMLQEIRLLPYYGRNNENPDLYMLDNMELSILEQVRQLVPDVLSVDVAVPYYDNGLSAVNDICSIFPGAKVKLYVQNGKSRFPVEKAVDQRFTIQQYRNLKYESDGKQVDCERFYHGKVLQFKTADKSYILYGSANCTAAALSRAFSENGNIECDVLEIGGRDEFDSYFAGFVEETTPLECERLEYEAPPENNIWFKYGLQEQNSVKLCFGYNGKSGIESVLLQDQGVDFSLSGNEIVVHLPLDQFSVGSEIFDVKIITAAGEKLLRCWVLDKENLALYRLPEKTDAIFSFSRESTGDKYYQDYITLLMALALSPEELSKEKEIINRMENHAVEVDAENSDDEDGGIIDYVPPPADLIRQYKVIKEVERIELGFRHSFRSWMHGSGDHSSSSTKPAASGQQGSQTDQPVGRDEDKSFIRFLKTKSRSLLNRDYLATVRPERYLARIEIFFGLYDKFSVFMLPKKKEKEKEPLLSAEYVADIKYKLLKNMAAMESSEETEEELTALIFLTIVSNHILGKFSSDSKVDKLNRELLRLMPQGEEYRQWGYIQHVIKAIDMWKEKGIETDLNSEIVYADSLFGYKPLSRIKDSLKADYGKTAEIIIDHDEIFVETTVAKIGDYMRIPEGSLYDINRYARARGGLKKFTSVIHRGSDTKGPDPAVKIRYRASSLPATGVNQEIIRKSGKKEVSSIPVTRSDD